MRSILSKLGLGASQFPAGVTSRGRSAEAEVTDMLVAATRAGLGVLDAGSASASAEQILGAAMPRPTSMGLLIRSVRGDRGPDLVEQEIRATLFRLRVPKARAIVVQSASDLMHPSGAELWKRLLSLRDEGLFDQVGVSAYASDEPAALARRFRPDLLQAPASLLDQRLLLDGSLMAVREMGIVYPVAMDNDYRIWRAFHNKFWPAHYFIDATGRIRYHHFGEGDYDQSETWIRSLLEERNHQPPPTSATNIAAIGAEAGSNLETVQSPETYIGYTRAENFRSPGGFDEDDPHLYRAPAHLDLNAWALTGKWKDESQIATLLGSSGAIVYRFHARDLHIVLGPGSDGKPVRFRVTLDGKPPGADHGMDTDADGYGTVTESRLYQLIRQQGAVRDRAFRIEFLTPGVQAFAFTFG